MTKPGLKTNPVARERRRECTETMEGAVLAARPAMADENEARMFAVGSVMAISSRVDPNLGIAGDPRN
jgi:hypothetical protein